MTEEDVRRIAAEVVLSLKDCLRPSHLGCERCSPGFNERAKQAFEACDEWRRATPNTSA